ncbi:MAG: MTH938/NDUFAF3 family protein [Hyphomicrobiaceae bacterium]|nr:MTH938/NDUFAF3 family protein [Hyphomicrobiaceae bacterium]
MAPGPTPAFPGRAAIDAYGNGGFRFAGMSHRGALLFLPAEVRGWTASAAGDIDLAALGPVIDSAEPIEVLLIGTGAVQTFLSPDVRGALEARGIVVETMTTGAAARTYNVLLAEGRAVAAALLPVE